MKPRLNKFEENDFALYLRQCTDAQVRFIAEDEKRKNHRQEARLAELEAARRNLE